jgi:hypothetical protein
MAKSVLMAGAIQATNVDSLVKFGKLTTGAIENGNVIALGELSDVAGENEVYIASTPATATLATAIYYMVNEPVNVLTDGKYLGLNDDPTNFEIPAGKVFTCYKPKVGDEIEITVDGVGGTKSTNKYVVPANGTGKLTWAANTSGVSLAYELVNTSAKEIPTGNPFAGRKVTYMFRCVLAQ